MKTLRWFFPCVLAVIPLLRAAEVPETDTYPNRAPLRATPFIPINLGVVQPRGWWLKQLRRQADGLSGHAEEVIPDLGPDSGWLGGDGEGWEKGAYYVKGMTTLAFVLNDPDLQKQVLKWIDWTLKNQRPDGQIGPTSNDDWWPRMVITWALRDYYEASSDVRALQVLTNYAHYMQTNLPKRPLTEWGKARACDQIDTLYWLYNRTGQPFLLETADLLRSQSNAWIPYFATLRGGPGDYFADHGVNVSQAMKYPLEIYQRGNSDEGLSTFKEAWATLQGNHGLGIGMWSGTQVLSGKSTTQGIELCTMVEQMLSSEIAMKVLADPAIGDQLERIAYNLLPGAITKDFKQYQFYTLPNQPVAHAGNAGFKQDHGDDLLPSPHSGFHCCCYNLHMGWPKFVQNAWMKTSDGGLAATVYGPSELVVKLAGTSVTMLEETDYPFSDVVKFSLITGKPVAFPLKLRIPGWSVKPRVEVNGTEVEGVKAGEFLTISRTWNSGDSITANFPALLETQDGMNGSVTLWRGPLLFSLQIKEKVVTIGKQKEGFNELILDPATPWNYALDIDRRDLTDIKLTRSVKMPDNPWLPETTPIKLTVAAKRVPEWGLTRNDLLAAEVPISPVSSNEPVEKVTLVPFGAQTLRITAFPLLRGEPGPEAGE